MAIARAAFSGMPAVDLGCSVQAMLKQFGQDIWIADGADVVVAGFHYPTRMAVIRLANGHL
uniref:hypothetical protein n=1 Tax=Klebsiella pneumoniae TaxID=573 RepID=UPI0019544AF1